MYFDKIIQFDMCVNMNKKILWLEPFIFILCIKFHNVLFINFCYSGNKEHIYVALVSSLSKDIPWKNLTLVIEYEADGGECWKSICKQKKIAHVSVKLASVPLKTLNDIKHLPLATGKHFFFLFLIIFF